MTSLFHDEARALLHHGRRALDNKTLAALDAHLAACAACRAYAADLDALAPALSRALHARWDAVQPPRPALTEDTGSARAPRRVPPALAWGTAALVLAFAVLLLPLAIAPPPAATPGPVVTLPLVDLPSPSPGPRAYLVRSVFAADAGTFTGSPENTTVQSPPRVIAWDTVSNQELWSAEVGLQPAIALDRAGERVFVISRPNANAVTLRGLTFDTNNLRAHGPDWPLRVSVLDAATGALRQAIDLPAVLEPLAPIGAVGDTLYVLAFSTGTLDGLDLAAGAMRGEHLRLCQDAGFPRDVQLAPDGSAVYALCFPTFGSNAPWVVQISLLDGGTPRTISLPPLGGAERWGNGLLLSHDGARLYVADTDLGLLGEIDTAGAALVRTAQYKPGSRQGQSQALMSLAPNDRLLYLGTLTTLPQQPGIWVVDTSDLRAVAHQGALPSLTLPPGETPPAVLSLAADPLGQLVVTTDQGAARFDLLADPSRFTRLDLPATVTQLLPYPADSPMAAPNPANLPTGLGLLAFERDNDVYVANADGSQARNLTQRPGRDYAPAWSPDGRYLAYLADRGDATDVMLLDVERALSTPGPVAPVLLKAGVSSLEFGSRLAWSPDGSRLAVSFWPNAIPGTTGSVIQLLDVAAALGGADSPAPLGPDRPGSDPRFSPDGTRLLYVGQDPPGVPALIVDDLQNGARVTLGVVAGEGARLDSYWTYNGFAWSPNGKFVAYLRVGPWLGAWPDSVLSRDSHAQISLVPPDGSSGAVVMDLAPAPNGILGLDYSPDGRVLSFIASQGYSACWNIHLLSLDDQALHRLPSVCHAMRTALPSWSPDGRWLAFTAGWDGNRPAADGNGALELTALDVFQYFFALDVAQRAVPVRLSTWVGDDLSPVWQPVCHSGIPNC